METATVNEIRIDTLFKGELAQKLSKRLAQDKDQNYPSLIKRLLLKQLDADETREAANQQNNPVNN